MLTRQERGRIRESIVETGRCGKSYRNPIVVPGGRKRLTPHETWQLLNTVDNAEKEIERLRGLVKRLYKIVNLETRIESDHKCLTRKTNGQLLTLLAEARAVVERKQAVA